MQTTEVTLKQWWSVMGKRFFGRRKGQKDMPVTKVSWYDCIDFIEKLNGRTDHGFYRLPTEAEWEYACRAGSKKAFSWGNDIDCSRAMFSNHRLKSEDCLDFNQSRGLEANKRAPVRRYPPNAWGLFDMHGNVWEWCYDWFSEYPTSDVTDPQGPDSGDQRVRRGGGWMGAGYRCRSANRAHAHPASRFRTTGFRLVWVKEGKGMKLYEPSEGPVRTEEGGP
jgi:formylglycine-generating enzyme required for sulfatase activity